MDKGWLKSTDIFNLHAFEHELYVRTVASIYNIYATLHKKFNIIFTGFYLHIKLRDVILCVYVRHIYQYIHIFHLPTV